MKKFERWPDLQAAMKRELLGRLSAYEGCQIDEIWMTWGSTSSSESEFVPWDRELSGDTVLFQAVVRWEGISYKLLSLGGCYGIIEWTDETAQVYRVRSCDDRFEWLSTAKNSNVPDVAIDFLHYWQGLVLTTLGYVVFQLLGSPHEKELVSSEDYFS